MRDKLKLVLAGLLLISSLVLPLVGLFYGWWNRDAMLGIGLMVGTFIILLISSGLLLYSIKDLTWFSVFSPYLFGAVYGFLPDSIAFSIDDAASTTAGALLSYALIVRKQPDTPKWIVIPLLTAGIYALLGGYIPGPIDEFLIDVFALLLAWLGSRSGTNGKIPLEE
jgi:hypothetical protein